MSVPHSSEVIFVNIYRTEKGRPYCGGIFTSEEEGTHCAAQGIGFVGSFPITIPFAAVTAKDTASA